MGTGAILLVFYTSPLIYAKSSYDKPVFVPKSPREPMILVWPSVMNPVVTNAVAKKLEERERQYEFLEIKCDPQSRQLNLTEVQDALVWIDEIPRRLKFWNELFPQLIMWLSSEAIECGINTIFREARHQIYRFIEANRSKWVNALQEVVYILLQVIAVIQNRTGAFQSMSVYKDLNWLEQWDSSYEYWYTHTPEHPLEFLQTFVLNSLDIVIAWLVDYMGQRAGARQSSRPNFCSYLSRPDNCTLSFRPSFNVQTKWNLSEDPDIRCALRKNELDIRCALRKNELVPWLTFPFDWVLEALDPPDRMKAMAHSFMTCEYRKDCLKIIQAHNETGITIWFGKYKDSVKILRLPKLQLCTLNCTPLPENFKHNAYALAHVTAEDLKYYTILHAYMTTEIAPDIICRPPVNRKPIKYELYGLRGQCMPRIVAKYLYDREYKTCCKRKFYCCEQGQAQGNCFCDCEVATVAIPLTDPQLELTSNVSFKKRYQSFPDLEKL